MSSSTGLFRSTHSFAVVPGRLGFESLAEDFLAGAEAEGYQPVLITGSASSQLYTDVLVSPHRVVDHFVALGREAVQEGFVGIRAAADVTPLLVTPESRRAYCRYEVMVEQRMRAADGMLHGLCVADGSLVDPEVMTDLCHLHERSAPDVEFRLFSTGSETMLSGWVDLSNIDDFTRMVDLLAESGPLTFRLDDCSFIDHRALRVIDAAAGSTGQKARLRGGPAYVGRLVDLLGLQQVEVIA